MPRSLKANGKLIARLRLKHALTQEVLAHKADCSRGVIQKLEKGSGCDPKVIENVAGILGTTLEELTEGFNEPVIAPDSTVHSELTDHLVKSGFIAKAKELAGDEAMILVLVVTGGIAGIVLAFAGLFPINARPLYVIGLVLSAIALMGAMAVKRRRGLAISACGIAATSVALWNWPNVVGFFPNDHGYSLRIGIRTTPYLSPTERTLGYVQVEFEGKVYENEPFGVRYDKTDIKLIQQGCGPLILTRCRSCC